MREKIKKVWREPEKIPTYIIRKTVKSDFRTDYKKWTKGEQEIYTWDGDRNWGYNTAPESIAPKTSANNYYFYKTLQKYIEPGFSRGLELGCGWGNVTSWINEFAEDTYGIDPNYSVLLRGKEHYPSIQFIGGVGQQLPIKSNSLDLIITNTVLMHIPPEEITAVSNEIIRVLDEGGVLLLRENFDSQLQSAPVWGRAKQEYHELFSELEIDDIDDHSDSDIIYDMVKLNNSRADSS